VTISTVNILPALQCQIIAKVFVHFGITKIWARTVLPIVRWGKQIKDSEEERDDRFSRDCERLGLAVCLPWQ
jgi:hypothetical protein